MLITALWCRGQGVVGKGNLKTILSLLGNSKELKTYANFISEEVTMDLNKKGLAMWQPKPLVFQGKKYKPTRKNQELE